MKKTLLALLLVATLCLPLFAGCSKDTVSDEPIADVVEEIIIDRTVADRVYSMLGTEYGFIAVAKNADGLPVAVECYDYDMTPTVDSPVLFSVEYGTDGKVSAFTIDRNSMMQGYISAATNNYKLNVCEWDESGRPVKTEATYGVTATLTYTDDTTGITFYNSNIMFEYSLTFDSIGRLINKVSPAGDATLTMDGNKGKLTDTSEGEYYIVLYYDDAGVLTKSEAYDEVEVPETTLTYKYNENKLCTETTMVESYTDGTTVESDKYVIRMEYDANGKCTKVSDYDVEENKEVLSSTYTYEYAADGKLVKETTTYYSDDNKVRQEYVYDYKYDDNGNMISSISTDYNENKKVTSYSEYNVEYDENGFECKYTNIYKNYGENGEVTYESSDSYEVKCDANGLPTDIISKQTYGGEEHVVTVKYSYELTDNGLKMSLESFDNGVKINTTSMEYSSKGKPKKSVSVQYDENGNESGRYETNYDEYGNRIENESTPGEYV